MIFDRREYHRKFRREIIDIQKLSEKTYEAYSCQLDMFFNWCESLYFYPEEINSEEGIKEYISQIKNPNSMNHALCALKKLYDDCLGYPLVVRYIKYAKKPQQLPEILSQEEILLLYNAINNPKQKFIFLILYSTGLRKSELENLKETDFDIFRELIIVKSGKGNKDRHVPMSSIIKEMLFDYKKYRLEEIKKFNFQPEYFFVGQFGGKYKSVNVFLKNAANKAGITKRVHEHLIRHCYATHMREKLIDIATIGQLLGHVPNSKQTFIYARLSKTVGQNAGTPLDSLMIKQQLLKTA